MHHKRKRSRNSRAGCKMCKPWKVSGAPTDMLLKPSENRLVQPDEGRPGPRHKASRMRWCRGKEGIEHELVCMTTQEAKGKPELGHRQAERFLVCKVCGKELKHFWGLAGQKTPEWVTR